MITYHALRSLPQSIRQIKDEVWLVGIKILGEPECLHNMDAIPWAIQQTQLNAYLAIGLKKPNLF